MPRREASDTSFVCQQSFKRMKLSLDAKFLTTALVTFAVLVVVITVVNAVAGAAVAMVAAAGVGTISVKLFDKFEYHPTTEIEFGAPVVSVPLISSAIASAMLLNGAAVGVDLFEAAWGPITDPNACRAALLVPTLLLDWGGFVLGGWLIGWLFPNRALGLATFAGMIVVLIGILELRHPDMVRFELIAACVGIPGSSNDLEGNELSFRIGSAFGLASRAYLAIAFARIATRTKRSRATIEALNGRGDR